MHSHGAARARAAAEAVGMTVTARTALMVLTAQGVIEAATEPAGEILGVTLDELIGRHSADPRWAAIDRRGVALRPRDHPAMRALATGEPVRGDIVGVYRPGRHHAGDHLWLRVDSVPFDRSGGGARAVTRLTVVPGDQAEEFRRAATERLHRFLVDHAPDVMAWQLPDSTFLWVSPSCRAQFGYAPHEMVGRTLAAFLHPNDVAATATALHQGTPVTVRFRHRTDGYRWMEVAGHRVRDADGTLAQLRTTWRDVTARVEAERERDEAVELVESVWDDSPIGIAICDDRGVLERVNDAMCVILGRTAAQLIGHSLQDFVHPYDECDDGLAALRTGRHMVHESETRYLRPGGTTMWGLRTTAPLRAGGGRRYLVHLQDVSLRRVAQQRLVHAASHDALTGLANRVLIDEHVARATKDLPDDVVSGMLFIDLDDFKRVNDTYGHDVGDELLAAVARRLLGAIRDHDIAGRIGGDEFVVFCPRLHDATDVTALAARVTDSLADPYRLGPHTVRISASIGATTAQGAQRATLRRDADRAMYRSKSSRSADAGATTPPAGGPQAGGATR
jgi:diguanylate cyclase (GGDEF)-like protein/PAS domain S-box-containing protein